jgi:hypothetical protein
MPITTNDLKQQVRLKLEALTKQGIDTEVRKTLHRALKGLQRVIEDMEQQEVLIGQDPRLTGEGRKECLATVVLQKVRNLSWLGVLLRDADTAYDRLHRILFTDPKKTQRDEVLAFLREQEIRAKYKWLKQSEIDLAYRQAVEQGNDEIVGALIFAPGGSLVSPSIQDDIDRQKAKAINPEGLRKLDDLQILRQELGILAKQTREWLRGLGADSSNASVDVSKSLAA